MQKKLGKEGLVVMTLNVDEDEKQRNDGIKYMEKLKVPFTNWFLAPGEKRDEWDIKLNLGQFPCWFLYDREGKQIEQLSGVEHEVLDQKVQEILSRK
jgi:hypothetical protein